LQILPKSWQLQFAKLITFSTKTRSSSTCKLDRWLT
jgi:hypothetical protein